MKNLCLSVFLLCLPLLTIAQSLEEKYKLADDFRKMYESKYYHGVSSLEAIDSTHCFWYRTNTPEGRKFMLIDADKKQKRAAFDHAKLAEALSVQTGKHVKADSLPITALKFEQKMSKVRLTTDAGEFLCDLEHYTIKKQALKENRPNYWASVYQENRDIKVKSPDGAKEAFIVEGNLQIKDLKTGKVQILSRDGSPYEYYSSNIVWSPDAKKIICCKYRPAGVRKLTLIHSAPKDQLQPKLEELDYVKPGDALPVRRPVLFDVATGTAQLIDVPNIENQFSLGLFRWTENSQTVSFQLNQRGHQNYFVYAADAANGKLRTIVHEQSPTFIHYGRISSHFIDATQELVWTSERDGWRHIYLYDTRTGKVKKQLTQGDWVVKSVLRVDEKSRNVLFMACGRDKNEDPYLEKYYSVNIDSGSITSLTPENATHQPKFSYDYTYLIDNYSRVDFPSVAVLRSVADGSVLMEVEKSDVSELVKMGWRMPEPFCSKGRDGVTDIWGIIIRPTDFDPAKKYPVVEYIYAGPHDAHVPKNFAVAQRTTGFSEIGFITVLIDGMGTANRSKAFHDICWRNLKDAGFPDRIAWLKAAAAKYPELDLDRVGIYGGSAGGQNAMGALLFHPEFYKVGVAACGCHDNRMDKIWWNEQWMGYPVGPWYEESSNVCNAHLLKGKLMLVLGEVDNNVDPASTLQVVDALIKSNKEFDFVMLPGVGHTLGEAYGERKRRDFFVKHLLHQEPPVWNQNL